MNGTVNSSAHKNTDYAINGDDRAKTEETRYLYYAENLKSDDAFFLFLQ